MEKAEDPKRKRGKRTKDTYEHEEDRLSSLPDGVLCHILSFLETKPAVQTSVLAKRYVNLWTSLPDFSFNGLSFTKLSSFENFVDRVLTLRDQSMEINSFNLYCGRKVSFPFLERVLNYAVLHGVRQLNIDAEYNKPHEFPESMYSSSSLRTFTLQFPGRFHQPFCLSDLTVLHLEKVKFMHANPFAGCPKLMDLTLVDCTSRTLNSGVWSLSAPELTKLNITNSTFGYFESKVALSAPKLASFSFSGSFAPVLSTNGLNHLEEVSIDIDQTNVSLMSQQRRKTTNDLVNMLRCFHNAKYITLSLGTIEVLSRFPFSLMDQPSPFRDLKVMKFVRSDNCYPSLIPTYVMSFLLKQSPDATIDTNLPSCSHCACWDDPSIVGIN